MFASAANAEEIVPSGMWTLQRDKMLNGSIESPRTLSLNLKVNETTITGNYVGIDNDSVFVGRSFASKRRPGQVLVTFTQFDQDFYATFVGILRNGRIVGTWHTVAGDSGDFVMTQ